MARSTLAMPGAIKATHGHKGSAIAGNTQLSL